MSNLIVRFVFARSRKKIIFFLLYKRLKKTYRSHSCRRNMRCETCFPTGVSATFFDLLKAEKDRSTLKLTVVIWKSSNQLKL